MDQARKALKSKRSLGEQEISDLFSDELSDIPCESSDSDSDIGSEQERIVATDNESRPETTIWKHSSFYIYNFKTPDDDIIGQNM
jgi:hypothetical protein